MTHLTAHEAYALAIMVVTAFVFLGYAMYLGNKE